MTWDMLVEAFASRIWLLAILGCLGVFLLALVRWARSARDSSQGGTSQAILFLALGLLVLVFTGAVVWQKQLWRGNFVSAERLRKLQETDLSQRNPLDALPGEWPQWRGPRRDGVSDEKNLRTDWVQTPPRELWRKKIHAGYSSIAIVGGRLYTQDRVGGDERVVCLDAKTGEELWVYAYAADYGDFTQDPNGGPRATPAIFDGRVYTVGASGAFLCLNAQPGPEQGKLLWRHDLFPQFKARMPTWGLSGSPLIEADLVIVQPGGSKGAVAAFDRKTGDLRWAALGDPAGYSSPMAATAGGQRQIICFTGKGLAGLRPTDGKQLWYHKWITGHEANIATPIVAADYVFISSNYSKGCALLELIADGTDGVRVGRVYEKLRGSLMDNHHATSVLFQEHLYGYDEEASSYKCVALKTGEEKWRTSEITKGCALCADGHLFTLSERGLLACVEATPEGVRIKGQLPVFEGSGASSIWALPALANGRLYVRNHREIVCFDLKP